MNIGDPIAVTGAGVYTTTYVIDKPAGVYPASATLTSNTPDAAGSFATASITVTPAGTVEVKLLDSHGNGISGGVVEYYKAGWKPFGTTVGGQASKPLDPGTYSFRMTYAYGTVQKSQNITADPIVIFQTANALVQLKSSSGNALDTGTADYYAGGWHSLGTTSGGEVSMELLPASYSFRMTYAFASVQKSQDLSANATVVFQTRAAEVQLRNSGGSLIDSGTVAYYSGGWHSFGTGTTSGGEATMELLPASYSFRMTYAFGSVQKSQDITANPAVVFQTQAARVELRNSQGGLMDGGSADYYSGGWHPIGATSGGVVTVELLPASYSFRMNYAFGSVQKSQDITANPGVVFQTQAARVELRNSQSALMDGGSADYYSGGWHPIGATSGGVVTIELLPASYSFRMNYAFGSVQKSQDITANPTVVFQTQAARVELRNSQGALTDGGSADYYSGGWHPIGATSGGVVTVELLPASYSFRMNYAFGSVQKSQNIATDPAVVFQTGQVESGSNSCTGYYAGGWRAFTNPMELLPGTYTFRFTGFPDTAFSIGAGSVTTIH